ncbi:PREDICTED: uncharacterized protein LOC108378029 [Rhagoletis zephyria]|uniref:uncharacterized protein LOC108378029 n=1 Tax=Rhagoletis zephyria TaxID=28612 RepID=UPI000811374F|nr:PREDICTED: uncharacterized protein LOC108378029 [Rhagoletis zephyria]
MGSLGHANVLTNNFSNCSKKNTSVHYKLFMYQEELRRRNARQIRIAKSKISLTDSLITENVQHLHDCSLEDLRIISREMSFKKHLQKQVSRYSKLTALGVNIDLHLQRSPTTTTL